MGTTRKIGLARTLSKRGLCSRTQAFILVRAGRVLVNRVVRRDPEFPVRHTDDLRVDGEPLRAPERTYLMMNKSRGLVTTASDERSRSTVYSLLPPGLPWVAPVGRLDKASEGLLLFTNDSQWAAQITSPESSMEKTYRVQIGVVADQALLDKLIEGVTVRRERLKAVRASIVRTGKRNSWIEIVLDEGRNRQIRRMLNAQGVEVLRLIRVAIGPLRLGDLPKGAVRSLTADEKKALDRCLGS